MVHTIDPHYPNAWTDQGTKGDTYTFFLDRINCYDLADWVAVHRQTSTEVARDWSDAIDFLFIDGDHSYQGVKDDFALFHRWMRPDGLIAFHDTLWDRHRGDRNYRADIGVPAFVEELRREGYPVLTIMAFPGLSLVSPIKMGWPLVPDPVQEVDRAKGADRSFDSVRGYSS